jgi:hypothetical protein
VQDLFGERDQGGADADHSAPPVVIERLSERHSPKARTPTITATGALALGSGATTATGSFSVPKP